MPRVYFYPIDCVCISFSFKVEAQKKGGKKIVLFFRRFRAGRNSSPVSAVICSVRFRPALPLRCRPTRCARCTAAIGPAHGRARTMHGPACVSTGMRARRPRACALSVCPPPPYRGPTRGSSCRPEIIQLCLFFSKLARAGPRRQEARGERVQGARLVLGYPAQTVAL